jgi:NAD dependent epimerase/dehydratase family
MQAPVMDRLVSECDVIYHLASAVGVELIVSRPVEVIERCILGTEIVLKTGHRYKKKVLLTNTSEVYGKNATVPFAEDDDRLVGPTTKSRWSYSCSKAIDEFLALAYHKEKHLPIVIVRLFNTVGPRQTGQYGMVVPRFVQQALAGKPLTVYGDGIQQRCFGYVGDTVGALIAAHGASRCCGPDLQHRQHRGSEHSGARQARHRADEQHVDDPDGAVRRRVRGGVRRHGATDSRHLAHQRADRVQTDCDARRDHHADCGSASRIGIHRRARRSARLKVAGPTGRGTTAPFRS